MQLLGRHYRRIGRWSCRREQRGDGPGRMGEEGCDIERCFSQGAGGGGEVTRRQESHVCEMVDRILQDLTYPDQIVNVTLR